MDTFLQKLFSYVYRFLILKMINIINPANPSFKSNLAHLDHLNRSAMVRIKNILNLSINFITPSFLLENWWQECGTALCLAHHRIDCDMMLHTTK
jgi:hypothetical protein